MLADRIVLEHVTKAEVKPVFGAIGPKLLIVGFKYHLRMKPERHARSDDAFVIERVGRKSLRDFLLRIESFISNERGQAHVAFFPHVRRGLRVPAIEYFRSHQVRIPRTRYERVCYLSGVAERAAGIE